MHKETETVCLVELADPEGWPLPPFTPGAHIDVHLPNDLVRQYSIASDPRDNSRYLIAVALEPKGRGGSYFIHNELKVGDILPVSLPRNLFPPSEAGRHILIAGGIGITPFLSMVPHFERTKQTYELHYCSRHAAQTPFRNMLDSPAIKSKVRSYLTREKQGCRPDLATIVGSPSAEKHVYCCGPESMVDAVVALTRDWPKENVHIERFGASGEDCAAYTVVLGRSGCRVPVRPGQSMLSALRHAGVEMPSSCEAGVCLECKTRYTEGEILHRDLVMSPADRTVYLTPCVSGCQSDTVTLDI